MLNKVQKEIVNYFKGPILVIAGPGTGKTKTLTEKVIKIQKEKLYKNVLAITFTNKAKTELFKKIKNKKVHIHTFHSLAHYFLNKNNNLKILGKIEEREIINKVLLKYKNSFKTKKELSALISLAKSNPNSENYNSKIVKFYNLCLKKIDKIDFNDLLILFLDYLKNNVVKYDYVLVDEFQDTNIIQYEIIKKIVNKNNIFAIGDPNQSIYKWRGVDSKIFDYYVRDFKDTKIFKLDFNYRNSNKILNFSKKIFPNTSFIKSVMKNDGKIIVAECENAFYESDFVVEEIQKRIGKMDLNDKSEQDIENVSFKDFVCLYRNHIYAKKLIEKLKKSQIPYQLIGSGSVFENEIFLEKINKLGKIKNLEKIKNISEHFKDFDDLKFIINRFMEEEKSLKDFYDYINNLFLNEGYDPNLNAVTLMTFHSAKGLEFENVFILNADNKNIKDDDEEKRLFYVAITRTKSNLFLSKIINNKDNFISKNDYLIKNALFVKKTYSANINKIARLRKQKLKKSQIQLF